VQDLIEKPMKGFVQGPLEGGMGLMQGANSLLKNTLAGACDSINKVSGTLSSGLTVMVLDDQYLHFREKMKERKPQHLLKGLQLGSRSVIAGFSYGFSK